MIPTLLWHQTPKHIHFQIELKDIQNEIFKFQNNHFTFQATSQNKEYQIDFDLFAEIEDNECSYAINDNNVKVIMTKKDFSNWNSLQKDKNLFKNNIKVNWDLFDESDDEDMFQNNMFPNYHSNCCSSDGCCAPNNSCSPEDYSLDDYLEQCNSDEKSCSPVECGEKSCCENKSSCCEIEKCCEDKTSCCACERVD